MRGKLVTVEGIDGSGKSTLCAGLAEALGDRIVALREPGGVPLAEKIRELVKDSDIEISAEAEALLFAAARAQLVGERIEPLLAEGRSVLLDRFVDSSVAYQGAGRGLGIERVRVINELAVGGLVPDLTLLVSVSPEVGASRVSDLDRIEIAGPMFFADVARAYDRVAASEPGRFRVLDGSQTADEVLKAALQLVEDLL